MQYISLPFSSKTIVLVLLVFFVKTLKAQTIYQNQVWGGYFLNLEFTKNYYLQTELTNRRFTDGFVENQSVIRSHLHKVFGNHEVSLGGCLFMHSPSQPYAQVRLAVPELRPHAEFLTRQVFSKFAFDHRYRIEARFFYQTDSARTELEDGFEFRNLRFRYRFQSFVLLHKKPQRYALNLRLFDEILIQTNTNGTATVFDQNRIGAALSLSIFQNYRIDLGYLNWFQQRSLSGFFSRNVVYLNFYHTIKTKGKLIENSQKDK